MRRAAQTFVIHAVWLCAWRAAAPPSPINAYSYRYRFIVAVDRLHVRVQCSWQGGLSAWPRVGQRCNAARLAAKTQKLSSCSFGGLQCLAGQRFACICRATFTQAATTNQTTAQLRLCVCSRTRRPPRPRRSFLSLLPTSSGPGAHHVRHQLAGAAAAPGVPGRAGRHLHDLLTSLP